MVLTCRRRKKKAVDPQQESCQLGSNMKFLDVPQSGSLQSQTSSRNRYGQYYRSRATPVNPRTTAQGTVRARLAFNAAKWRTITDAQRAAWATLGLSMVRPDALGQNYSLTGFQAFVSVNNNLLEAGEATIVAAPAIVTPTAITSVTVTLTAAAFSVVFAATPLGAGESLFLFAGPGRSAGRSFEGDTRFVVKSTAAQASPLVATSAYTAKYGVPVVGNRVFMSFQVHKGGFLSGPLRTSQIVA